MKKLITTLLLVISSITFAQEKLKTEWLGYIPMRTYHWDRTNIEKYHPTEGGNIGLVLIRRKIQTDKVYTEKQVGITTGYKDMNAYTISIKVLIIVLILYIIIVVVFMLVVSLKILMGILEIE